MKNRKRLAAFGLVAAMCLGACGSAEENGRGRMENDGNGDTPEETVREMPAEAETPTKHTPVRHEITAKKLLIMSSLCDIFLFS